MIGESSPGEPAMTYGTLAAPSDSTFDVGVVVGAVFVLAGLGIGRFWRHTNAGRAVLVCAGLLAAVAVYRVLFAIDVLLNRLSSPFDGLPLSSLSDRKRDGEALAIFRAYHGRAT